MVHLTNPTGDGYSQTQHDAALALVDDDEVSTEGRDHSHKHPDRRKEKAECKSEEGDRHEE